MGVPTFELIQAFSHSLEPHGKQATASAGRHSAQKDLFHQGKLQECHPHLIRQYHLPLNHHH